MALNPTRISNIRTAGWLMLGSFAIGLLAGALLILWEAPQYGVGVADLLFSNINGYLATALLLAGNLPALLAAVGLCASRNPAHLSRALTYLALGGVIELGLFVLLHVGEEGFLNFITILAFHLLVALTLILLLVRKSPLPTRSLTKRSAAALTGWGVVVGVIATLTFPFTQYGSATAGNEDPEVHELRQVSEQMLVAIAPELKDSGSWRLKGSSSNQVSVFGSGEFGCKFNTTPVIFEGSFKQPRSLSVPAPKLVLKEQFSDPTSTKPFSESDRKGLTANPNYQYTDASRKASEKYWDGMKERIQAEVGNLPDGWTAKYTAKDGLLVIATSKQTQAQVFFNLKDEGLLLFSGISQNCYPLNKAPNDR